MAKKTLTKDEYAEATGLAAGGAERLYQDLRNWRRAKTREDLRKGLYLTESAFAAASPRHAPRPYQRDYRSPAEVQAMQADLLKEISKITEGRRKDAEAYRKALLEAAVRVQGKRSDASVARMKIQGDLVKKAHDELKTQYKVVSQSRRGQGGGDIYVEDGELRVRAKPLPKSYLEDIQQEVDNAREAVDGNAAAKVGQRAGLFQKEAGSDFRRPTDGEEDGEAFFNKLAAAKAAGKDEELSVFDAAAMGIYGGVFDPEEAAERFEEDLLLYALGTPNEDELNAMGITYESDGTLNTDGADEVGMREFAQSRRRLDDFDLWTEIANKVGMDREVDGDGSGSRGGSYVQELEGLSPEQYQARLAQIHSVMQSIGAGGGPIEPIMAQLLGAGDLSMEQLQGIEEKLKVTVTQPMSQGEGESGRTPTGEGALPPGTSGMATGQRDRKAESPGEQFANKIQDVQDPDAALGRMWEMYGDLDNARTSAMDVHLLGQIHKSPPWLQMKQKLGIEDNRKALKAAMMMTRQRKRDANIRDSSKLREIRKETKRSSLLGGLSKLGKPKDKPPRPASAGAMLTGGADGFPGDE